MKPTRELRWLMRALWLTYAWLMVLLVSLLVHARRCLDAVACQ